jgi:hypothetical protein
VKAVVAVAVSVVACVISAVAVASRSHMERFAPVAADQLRARQIGFRASDVPAGWTSASITQPPGGSACAAYDPDLSRFTLTGYAGSVLATTDQLATSLIELFRSRTEAAADFRLMMNTKAWSCFRKAAGASLGPASQGGSSTGSWKLERVSANMYALTATFAGKTSHGVVPVRIEYVTYVHGRGIACLMFVYPAAKPVPNARAMLRRAMARSASM